MTELNIRPQAGWLHAQGHWLGATMLSSFWKLCLQARVLMSHIQSCICHWVKGRQCTTAPAYTRPCLGLGLQAQDTTPQVKNISMQSLCKPAPPRVTIITNSAARHTWGLAGGGSLGPPQSRFPTRPPPVSTCPHALSILGQAAPAIRRAMPLAWGTTDLTATFATC